jgi:hypothetical protein
MVEDLLLVLTHSNVHFFPHIILTWLKFTQNPIDQIVLASHKFNGFHVNFNNKEYVEKCI